MFTKARSVKQKWWVQHDVISKTPKLKPFLFHSLFSFPQETNQSKSIKTIGGGFNPFEQYQSNPIISPQIRGENKTSLKPPPRKSMSKSPKHLSSCSHPDTTCTPKVVQVRCLQASPSWGTSDDDRPHTCEGRRISGIFLGVKIPEVWFYS